MEKNNNLGNDMDFDLSILPVKTNREGTTLRHKIHPNLPDIERGSVLLLIMRRGEGKGTLINNLLLNPNFLNKDNFDYTFIISNTINQDLTAQHLLNEYEATCFDRYDDSIINDVIKFQKSFNKEDRPRTAIVLDDCLGSVPKNSVINFLTSRSRHILNGGLLLMSSQTIKSIAPVARVNATQVILGRTDNEKEKEKFYEEFGSIFGSKDTFYKMFDYATKDRYNYLYLNLDKGRPKAFKNFNEDITDKFSLNNENSN